MLASFCSMLFGMSNDELIPIGSLMQGLLTQAWCARKAARVDVRRPELSRMMSAMKVTTAYPPPRQMTPGVQRTTGAAMSEGDNITHLNSYAVARVVAPVSASNVVERVSAVSVRQNENSAG